MTISDWAAILTAAGTFAAAAVAVGIALWSNSQAKKERARSHEREQFAEAYKVRVVQGERPAPGQSASSLTALVLVAIVVNGGSYTITGVEVQFSPDGKSLVSPSISDRVSSFTTLPDGLRKEGDTSEERAMRGVLTPWDTGMRSETDEVGVQLLKGHYALVRWTDRWGTRWEHRRGKVSPVSDDKRWSP